MFTDCIILANKPAKTKLLGKGGLTSPRKSGRADSIDHSMRKSGTMMPNLLKGRSEYALVDLEYFQDITSVKEVSAGALTVKEISAGASTLELNTKQQRAFVITFSKPDIMIEWRNAIQSLISLSQKSQGKKTFERDREREVRKLMSGQFLVRGLHMSP